MVTVRADWNDSSDVIGYVDPNGRFHPGILLCAARAAAEDPERMHVIVLDEMNLARVEHYFPEFLSVAASRRRDEEGVARTSPLLSQWLADDDAGWNRVELPENLAVIGTVNMDEAGTGFSARVLDRAFTLEMPAAELTEWSKAETYVPRPAKWPASAWLPRALDLEHLDDLTSDENRIIERAIALLGEMDRCLVTAQFRCHYRQRNAISLFALHAANIAASFRDVNPLDLAIHAKVLPRIRGGSAPVRLAVMQLLGMALAGTRFHDERDAGAMVQRWRDDDCPEFLPEARMPFTAARLCLMWQRLEIDGETSFW
jgi:5-methylcytosine-specific restriction enzyme B